MQALTRPASRGIRWFSDGFRIYRRKPIALSALVLGYWMLMALASNLPLVGQIIATLLIPVFSVSLMNACRNIELERRVLPEILFSGFRSHLNTLLTLGGIYLAASMAILGLTALVDDGALLHLFLTGERPDEASIASGNLMVAGQVGLVLFLPLIMAFWYAPVLAAWHGLPAAKSLFFSVVACLRNWRAFLAYTLAVFVLGALVPGLVVGVLSALQESVGGLFTTLFMFGLVFVFLPTLYASFYVSYRDVFVTVDANA